MRIIEYQTEFTYSSLIQEYHRLKNLMDDSLIFSDDYEKAKRELRKVMYVIGKCDHALGEIRKHSKKGKLRSFINRFFCK